MKKVLKGILGLVLVFGFGMVLTGCGPQTVDIRVTNSSPFEVDDVVRAQVFMPGRTDPIMTRNVPRGESYTFSLDSGDYWVRVSTGAWLTSHFRFPELGTMHLSGDVRLNFNGNTLRRTN